MAEYLLGNKARELLEYTHQATRPVNDDVSQSDVRTILRRIAALDDIRDARSVCEEIVGRLDARKREGFTKSNRRDYGLDMVEIAKRIVRNIHAANDKKFEEEYEQRLQLIGSVIDDCGLLEEYIVICLELKIIDIRKCEVWTKKVKDVKFMSISWKKKDTARANKKRAEAEDAENQKQIALVRTAIRQEAGTL